jgi:hypothetical protein
LVRQPESSGRIVLNAPPASPHYKTNKVLLEQLGGALSQYYPSSNRDSITFQGHPDERETLETFEAWDSEQHPTENSTQYAYHIIPSKILQGEESYFEPDMASVSVPNAMSNLIQKIDDLLKR